MAAAAPAAPTPVLNTPLLSFRRVPGLIARDLNDDSFAAAVSAFAGTLDATSCLVVQLDGVEVGAHNPDLPVIPASNQKLLVAAAALEVLGPDHVFTTEVRGGPVNGGVVAGDLYLVGGGDPLLTTDDYPADEINGYPVLNATSLDTLADSVAAAGITQVDGNIVGDGSRYDDEWFHPSWPDDIHVTEAGPLDALLVNDARFLTDDWQVANDPNAGAAEELGRLLEERGITIGGDVATGTAPADAAVVAVDRLGTAAGGDRRDAGVERQQHRRAAAQGARRGLAAAAGPRDAGAAAADRRAARRSGSTPPASSSTTVPG